MIDGSSSGTGPGGTGLQYAEVDPSTGIPQFPQLVDLPCPGHVCDDGQIEMINPDEMIAPNILENPNSIPEYVSGATALEAGGGFGELGSGVSYRPGPGEFTTDGHNYYGIDGVALEPFEFKEGEYSSNEWGDSWLQEWTPDGEALGAFLLPHQVGARGLFALGSGLYIADEDMFLPGTVDPGLAYRLAPGQAPVSTELDSDLGVAMTGFLLAGSEGTSTEKGTSEAPGSETSSGSPSPGSGTPSPTGTGGIGGFPKPPIAGAPSLVPPPNTKITSVKLSGKKTTIKFTGVGGVGKLEFHCELAKTKKTTKCHSPEVYSNLAPGKHRFSVFAVDSRGEADPTPAKVTFTTK